MMISKSRSVAVIGAGIAGATVARALARAGHSVHVFDKARGPGGRLATRRVEWVDRQGHAVHNAARPRRLGLHGQRSGLPDLCRTLPSRRVGWSSGSPGWRPAVCRSRAARCCTCPRPTCPRCVVICLDGVPVSLSFAVDGLHRDARGWQVQAGGVRHASTFDAVVLALPPAQAAPLLNPHRPDWARHASTALMQPCWTLMGIADDPDTRVAAGTWLGRPPARWPGCCATTRVRAGPRVPGQAHWVAHARTGWSRRHLEQPAAWVQQQMQAALAECLGRPVEWQHCAVHRWRYALPQAHGTAPRRIGAGGTRRKAWVSAATFSAARRCRRRLVVGAGAVCGAAAVGIRWGWCVHRSRRRCSGSAAADQQAPRRFAA